MDCKTTGIRCKKGVIRCRGVCVKDETNGLFGISDSGVPEADLFADDFGLERHHDLKKD